MKIDYQLAVVIISFLTLVFSMFCYFYNTENFVGFPRTSGEDWLDSYRDQLRISPYVDDSKDTKAANEQIDKPREFESQKVASDLPLLCDSRYNDACVFE